MGKNKGKQLDLSKRRVIAKALEDIKQQQKLQVYYRVTNQQFLVKCGSIVTFHLKATTILQFVQRVLKTHHVH